MLFFGSMLSQPLTASQIVYCLVTFSLVVTWILQNTCVLNLAPMFKLTRSTPTTWKHTLLGPYVLVQPEMSKVGTSYFMSLDTGYLITRNPWTELPMPNDVIRRVNRFGRDQDAPKSLSFGNRYGHELHDNPDDIDNNHDDDFHPDDDSAYDTDLDNEYLDDFDDEDPDNPDHHPDHVNEAALSAAPTGVNIVQNHEDKAR
jgi:hypothetical protein